jgi:deoxyribodipyrimidine photolyase
MTNIVWLRRDLQIADNASIHFAAQMEQSRSWFLS